MDFWGGGGFYIIDTIMILGQLYNGRISFLIDTNSQIKRLKLSMYLKKYFFPAPKSLSIINRLFGTTYFPLVWWIFHFTVKMVYVVLNILCSLGCLAQLILLRKDWVQGGYIRCYSSQVSLIIPCL